MVHDVNTPLVELGLAIIEHCKELVTINMYLLECDCICLLCLLKFQNYEPTKSRSFMFDG